MFIDKAVTVNDFRVIMATSFQFVISLLLVIAHAAAVLFSLFKFILV